MFKSPTAMILIIIFTSYISLVASNDVSLFRVPMPHQLGNIIDLLSPIHIRLVTDGAKHHPVVRFPVLDLISRGQIFNKPGIHHLIHGPGIPW
uniref:Uncharacterized protein n=1 Tax=Tetranychus urticae TaxID=32264 RepID=T1JSU6_TETUR